MVNIATSGSKTITVNYWLNLIFEWTATTQSTVSNYTVVDWQMKLVAGNGSISAPQARAWHITVDGVNYSGESNLTISKNSTVVLAKERVTVFHNADGTRSFNFSFAQYFGINFGSSTGYVGTLEGSGSGTLNSIPRASTLTVSNGTLGVAQTITADRKSEAFSQTLTWKSGNYSGTICDKQLVRWWSWTPPMELANGAPNGTSVYCEFTLSTYSGSTLIGTDTKSVYMTIPDSVKPSCVITINDAEGYVEQFGGYIQGKSKLHILVTPTKAYNSPITAYSVNAGGNVYTTAESTTPIFLDAGTVNVSATVKDGRNRTGTTSVAVNIIAYNEPNIESVKVIRCDADGTENDRGLYCKTTFSFDVCDLSGLNGHSAYIRYKTTTETEYTDIELETSAHTENMSVIFPANDAYSYDVMLQVADNFATTRRKVVLSTGFTLMHFASSGKGLALGKVSERDGLDVGMESHFRSGLTMNIPVLATANCNTLTTSGIYYIGIYGTNKPADGLNGWLTVKSSGDETCHQEYTTYTGHIYVRIMRDGEWKTWRQLFTYQE